jgi:hypothetical protein
MIADLDAGFSATTKKMVNMPRYSPFACAKLSFYGLITKPAQITKASNA